MITDLVIGIGHTIYAWIIGVLPEMPEQPQVFKWLFELLRSIDYYLPISEIIDFTPVMLFVFGALTVWRVVRLATPGG